MNRNCFFYQKGHRRKVIDLSLPLALQIELTERCNFKCPFCYNNSGIRKESDIHLEEMKRILFDLKALGGVFLCVLSGGEPLLYKDELLELMDILHEDKVGMVLITNGYFMDEEFVKKICKYDWYWIQISLDSSIPIIHDEIRGVEGSYSRAINAISLLKKYGLPVAISSVICDKNVDDIEGIVKKAVEHNVDCVMFSQVFPVGRTLLNPKLQLNLMQKMKYNRMINKVTKKYSAKVLVRSAQPFNKQKNVPRYGMIIRPNGDVKIDCTSEQVVGNAFLSPIKYIWDDIKKAR